MTRKIMQAKRSALWIRAVYVVVFTSILALGPFSTIYAHSDDDAAQTPRGMLAQSDVRVPDGAAQTPREISAQADIRLQDDADDGGVYSALASGQRIMQERAYVTPANPTVYLTFDDGPSALTPQVLDILRDEGVKATFFALGEQAKAHPDIIKRIVGEGHALGNHTYNHVYRDLYSGFTNYWEQLQKSEAVFADIANVRPKIIRAPGGTYGNFDAFYFYYLDRAGYTVFDWNIDSGDSLRKGVPAREIFDRVKKGPFLHEVIVLMHDGSGHGETVKALPDIIRLFKDKGYDFAVLSENVKPVTFPLTKTKWVRDSGPAAYRSHLAMLAGTVSEARTRVNDGAVDDHEKYERNFIYESQVAVGESVYALKQRISADLSLWLDGKNVELSSEQYEFRNERFYVPLRLLVENMGGRVNWDETRRTAVVDYGFYRAEYDISANTLTFINPWSSAQTVDYPEMSIKNGSLMVPLRNTLEMFGSEIRSYTLSWDKKEVRTALSAGFSLARSGNPAGESM